MPTVITGTDGINQVQAGAVESGDLASGAIGSGDLPAGSVIQVVSTGIFTNTFSTTSSSFQKTNLFASITPLFLSSKIFISMNAVFRIEGSEMFIDVRRNNTSILIDTNGNNFRDLGGSGFNISSTISVFDEPNTTSLTEYALYLRLASGANSYVYLNQCVTLMEIAG